MTKEQIEDLLNYVDECDIEDFDLEETELNYEVWLFGKDTKGVEVCEYLVDTFDSSKEAIKCGEYFSSLDNLKEAVKSGTTFDIIPNRIFDNDYTFYIEVETTLIDSAESVNVDTLFSEKVA